MNPTCLANGCRNRREIPDIKGQICGFLPACLSLHGSNLHRRFYTDSWVSVATRL